MESQSKLIEALVKAQSEMSHAVLDSVNPHFRSKFATLKSVIDAVKPALNGNGIAFIQEAVQVEGGSAIETVFVGHGSSYRTGPVPIVVDKDNAQGFGSGLTYSKRYSLSMACGVSSEEDDDGNAAAGAPPKRRPQSVTKTVLEEEGIKVDQGKKDAYISQLMEATSDNDEPAMKELLDELRSDSEMKLAVWAELPSNIRSAIRKVENPK